MPSPDQMFQHQKRDLADRFPALAGYSGPVQPDLAAELRALRMEIAELRADLKPVPSLILTGQQVAAEFKRLAGERA